MAKGGETFGRPQRRGHETRAERGPLWRQKLVASDSFFLRFLWGPRAESVDQCADRLNTFLSKLNEIDSAFAVWRNVDYGRKEYRVPIRTTLLAKWLTKGVNLTDIGKKVIPELGYSVSLLCGEENAILPLWMSCGVYSPWNYNNCSFQFPPEGVIVSRILHVSALMRIAKSLINCWDPDHGVITTYRCSELLAPKGFEWEVGWITYLSPKYKRVSRLPPHAHLEFVDGGQLIILTDGRFSCSNADDLRAARMVAAQVEYMS
jgi:hypothetical protein